MDERISTLINNSTVWVGSKSNLNTCIFVDNESGVRFRVVNVTTKKGGKPTVVSQFTDTHFNSCDVFDMQNVELLQTFKKRTWLSFGESKASTKKAVEFCKKFDKTVVTGDIFDYLSHGAVTMAGKYLFGAGLNLTAIPGGHDFTRQMQTHLFDRTTLASRVQEVQNAYPNDIFYVSEVLEEKVMLISMLNDSTVRKDKNADENVEFNGHYLTMQLNKLENDLKKAREKDLAVLIFQHEPISTGKDGEIIKAFKVYDKEEENFFKLRGNSEKDTETDKKVYELITKNSDLIKGLFCGHLHSAYYSEVAGRTCAISQHVLEANVYDDNSGHVMLINIE